MLGGARPSKLAGSKEIGGDDHAGGAWLREPQTFGGAAGVEATTSGRCARQARQSWGAESATRESGIPIPKEASAIRPVAGSG
jgi:hypothetical protein